jgi:hypothetical protein
MGAGFTGRDDRRMDRLTREMQKGRAPRKRGSSAYGLTFNQPIRNGNTTETQGLYQRKPSPFASESVTRMNRCKLTRSD